MMTLRPAADAPGPTARLTAGLAGAAAPRPGRRRGAALLVALWAIITLSAAILIWAGYIRHTVVVAGSQENNTDALAMARSGIELALHPLVKKETPVLQQWANQDPGFRVRMVSEGGKLNINTLLNPAPEDPKKIDLFKRWLEYRGIDYNTRERMVACILDWLDMDDVKRDNGMENAAGYHPPNRGTFREVEELAQVAGTEALTSQPGWADELTVDSNGQIDLTAADFEVLRLLPGVGDGGIERFIEYRRGDDGIDGTLDDPPIQKIEDVKAFLGLNDNQWQFLGGLVSVKDANWRIISDGWAGKVHRHIEVVALKGSQNPTIKRWKE
jgi:hypothetical protein